ncbi:MAG: AsmA family protein, partial [Planctomycetota bacterium]
ATMTTAGRLKIFGFRVDGKALSSEAVQVEWGDARIDPAGRSFAARSARVRGDFLKADVADAAVRLGDVPEVQGRLSVEADLPAVRAAARPWRTWPDGPDPRGLLKLTGQCKTLDGTYRVRSTAELIDPAGGARTAGVSVDGSYGLASGKFRVQVASDGFDLAPVAAQAEAFGAKLPAPPAGRVAIKATASRADADAPVVTSGSLQATALHVGGTEISSEVVKATWDDVRVNPADRSLAARTVHVTGEPMELTAEDVSVNLGGETAVTGRLDADADLGRCLALAGGFVERGRLPRITGRLTLRGKCAARDGRASFDGEGKIRGGAGGERVMLWVDGNGFHEKDSGAAGATVKLTRLNLAYLALAIEPFGPEGLKGLAGTVAANAEITRAGADAPILATGSASGMDLAVNGKAVPGGHLKLRWIKAGYLPATKDLSVKSVLLESEPAGINGQDIRVRWGPEVTAAGKLKVTADLAACHAAARPFVKLPDGPAPTGWLTLAGTVRTADGRIDAKADARIRELRRRAGDQGLPVLTAGVEGWYAARTGALAGDVNVSRADVAYLGRLAQTLGREGMAAYGGEVQVRTTFGRRASGAPIAAGGAGRLTGLSVDARPVAGADADFEWSGARIGPAGKDVAVALAKLTSALASVSARDVQCRFGEDLTADGKLTVRADLARCLAVARPIAKWKQTPPVAGRLEANATVRSGGGNVDLAASGGIDDFRYGTGAKVVQEKRIDFGVDARVNPSNQIIALNTFKVDSKLLATIAAGTVWEYRTRRVIDLKGRYRVGWDA